jgi:hypothetical protein
MDTLDYGISSPQLALMNNGQVFVAGQIEPPMNPPSQSQTQTKMGGIRAMDAGMTSLVVGSDLFGTITTGLPMVEITQVQCNSGIDVSYDYGTVNVQGLGPNWMRGVSVNDGWGSSRPAVYLVSSNPNGKPGFSVNLSIQGAGTPQTATLKGTLQESSLASCGYGPLVFEGQFTLGNTNGTDQTVQLNIDNLPNDLRWFRGDAQWTVTYGSKVLTLPMTTRLEIFTVLDTPSDIYGMNGVWPEVLRGLFDLGALSGKYDAAGSLAYITNYLINDAGYIYNNDNGGVSNYLTDIIGNGKQYGGVFALKSYLLNQNTVNCSDQSAGIQAFAGALGIQTNWQYSMPFGFIPGDVGFVNGDPTLTTYLVGIGQVNNPFSSINSQIGWNNPARNPFTRHNFIMYNNMVFDATAGVHVGTETLNAYQLSSIDGFDRGNPDNHNSVLYSGTYQGFYFGYGPVTPGTIKPNLAPGGVSEVQ